MPPQLGGSIGVASGQNASAGYFLEYPKNIHLLGLSFNTQLPNGIALQGEYSYRPNVPLQRAATELLLAALNVESNFAPVTSDIAAGSEIRGWKRVKAHQIQTTATQVIPTILGAQQLALVGEVGYTFLDLPSGILFDGPGTALPALASASNASGGSVQQDGYATQHSWGYRAVARLDYLSLLGAVNVSPRAVFSHDVKGVSPTFNEGAQAVTLGVNFNYQQVYTVDVSYTSFFGGREILRIGQSESGTGRQQRPVFRTVAGLLHGRQPIEGSRLYRPDDDLRVLNGKGIPHMKLNRISTSLIAAAFGAMTAFSAQAEELNTMGADIGANAAGTIPAWTGEVLKAPAGFKPGILYPDPFASEKPVLVITPANADEHKANLTAGQLATFKKYPNYKINVYPTHRTGVYPKGYYDETKGKRRQVEAVGLRQRRARHQRRPAVPDPEDRQRGDLERADPLPRVKPTRPTTSSWR